MGLAERNTGEHPLDLRYSHLRLHAAPALRPPHHRRTQSGFRKSTKGL